MQRRRSMRPRENGTPASTRFHRWVPSVVLFSLLSFDKQLRSIVFYEKSSVFNLSSTHASPHYSCTFKHVLSQISLPDGRTHVVLDQPALSFSLSFLSRTRMSERVPRIIIPSVHERSVADTG